MEGGQAEGGVVFFETGFEGVVLLAEVKNDATESEYGGVSFSFALVE